MVIMHVLPSFKMGGQEAMAVELGRRQVVRGHRVFAVSIALNEPDDLEDAFKRHGVTPLHVPKRGPSFDISLPIRLRLAYRRHSIDLAHLHNQQPMIYGALAALRGSYGVLTTRHGLVEGTSSQVWMRRRLIRRIDAYVAVSRDVADNTRTHRLAFPPKLTVIENGIDVDRYAPNAQTRAETRAELGIPECSRVIGSVCRLVECKNVALLLRASLPRLNESTRLVIVGDGPEKPALENMAHQDPRGRWVQFLGQRSDVARLLNAFDLWALSSTTEGHPLAVLEAMATGLPILATQVGGIPEIVIDGETGFLTTVDEGAFSARLQTALEHSETWSSMGAAGRSVARSRFSAEAMASRYESLYQTVLASRGR